MQQLSGQEKCLSVLQDKIQEDGKIEQAIKSWAKTILKPNSFDSYYETLCNNNKIQEKQEHLNELLKSCFNQIDELKAIVLVGWTPSFNDGDVCTHLDEAILFTTDELIETGYLTESLLMDIDDDATTAEIKAACTNFNGNTVNLPDTINYRNVYLNSINSGSTNTNPDINKALQMLSAQNFASDIHDTNYVLAITKLDNGEIKIEKTDYWCGY